MRRVLSLSALLVATPAWAQSVWVTELLTNSLGNELTDEWIELFNGGTASVNLQGWVLADETADRVVLPSITIPAGGYVILTKDGAGFVANWGVGQVGVDVFTVNYGALSNGTDELVLTNPAGTVVWQLAYDNDEDEGFATHLVPAIPGRTAWGSAAAPGIVRNGDDVGLFGVQGYESGDNTGDAFAFAALNGDVGSPLDGPYALAAAPISPSLVVISEVMYQSMNAGVQYPGDWFELYNPGAQPVSLTGWTARDGHGAADAWTFPNVSLPAGGRLIVTANPSTFVQTWGVGAVGTTVIGNASVPSLGGEDEIELYDAQGRLVWSVAWDAPGTAGDGFGLFYTGSTYTQRDWGQIGRRRVRIDGPDDVAGAPAGYQSGAYTDDPAAFLGGVDRASPLAVAANVTVGPLMIVSGVCPGSTTFALSNLTPSRPWALVGSPALGSFTIPSGGCAGTRLPLSGQGIRLLGTFQSDASGRGSFQATVPAAACTWWTVAVDLTTCGDSGPISL